jgi:hypothetical protein
VTVGSGATVGTADFSAGTGTVDATNPLTVTNSVIFAQATLGLSGGASSFTVSNPSGGDIIHPTASSHRTITAAGGTLSVTLPTLTGTDGAIGGAFPVSSSYSDGVWTVSGNTGLAGPAGDNHAWHYVSLPSGDFDVKVRVTSPPPNWERAGVMVRDGLTQSDNYAAVWAVSGGGGACAAYGIASSSPGTKSATTYKEDLNGTADWLEIRKTGSTITTFYSNDHGATFITAYTTTFPAWGSTTYLGLDVSYVNTTGTFDNVSFLNAGLMPDWSTTDFAVTGSSTLALPSGSVTGAVTLGNLSLAGAGTQLTLSGIASQFPAGVSFSGISASGNVSLAGLPITLGGRRGPHRRHVPDHARQGR